jgi:hypothetical protein
MVSENKFLADFPLDEDVARSAGHWYRDDSPAVNMTSHNTNESKQQQIDFHSHGYSLRWVFLGVLPGNMVGPQRDTRVSGKSPMAVCADPFFAKSNPAVSCSFRKVFPRLLLFKVAICAVDPGPGLDPFFGTPLPTELRARVFRIIHLNHSSYVIGA